ncbi:hypothetical protein BBF96_07600 [Anoxybacter fermentans]|uniref:MalT-like TPR region domain-containing protein n=1 Tax=Anoxybacter fermentans TaxID=1323375 RepID=A0A3S9SYC5_9FIRM|nr:tetratricopeptide repeat protein [Anoxybacter fermentans]AZR73260.1 hypothetical protein BBF96_07600 [Anoxybacter fermentans]
MQTNYFAEALYEKAEALYLHKDYTETIQLLKKTLEHLENQQPPLKGQIYLLMAKTYFAMAQYRDARKTCEKALEFFLSHDQIHKASQTYQLIGQIYYHQGLYKDAIQTYQQALKILPIQPLSFEEKELKAQIHISLGLAAQQIQAVNLEQKHFLRSLFISRRLQNHKLTSQALLGLGICSFQKQKFNMARKILLKTVRYFNYLNESQGIALALHTLGQIYAQTGEYRRAVNALKYAYSLFEQLSDQIHQASSLVHLARIFLKIDHGMSQRLCQEATDLLISQSSIHSKRDSEIILGQIYVVMGLYYKQLNEIELARNFLKEGLEIFQLYHFDKEYQKTLQIYQNLKALEPPTKPKNKNVLAFKLGMIS